MRLALVVGIVLASGAAHADMLGHDRMRAHIDDMFAHLDVGAMSAQQRRDLYVGRASLTLGTLVPVLGSYRLEHAVFGELRPSAIVFDWVLGGLLPVALGVTAFATSGRTRKICAWSAIGLYAATRISIFVIANLHVSEYNRQVRLHLGAVESSSRDRAVPALMATMRW